jgi:class 3 adenylate cyclase
MDGPVLELGVGLDYGDVFVGNIGGKNAGQRFRPIE